MSWRASSTVLLLTLSATAAWGTSLVQARRGDSPQRAFLANELGFSGRDLQALDARQPVVHALDATDSREVAFIGALALAVPAAFYVEQLQDIARFKRSPAVRQIGVLGSPATAADLGALTLPPNDVKALQHCRPRDCDVQLSAEAIARFQAVRRGGDAAAQTNAVMRDVLAGLANAYLEHGDAGLMSYADGTRPTGVANEFRSLIGSKPAILARIPPLYDHLLAFPRRDDVRDLLYWSQEAMGPVTVVGMTHLAIARLDGPVAYAIASKQIYATHYFDASLGITMLLASDTAASSAYLVYVNRSRIDAFGGLFGGSRVPWSAPARAPV